MGARLHKSNYQLEPEELNVTPSATVTPGYWVLRAGTYNSVAHINDDGAAITGLALSGATSGASEALMEPVNVLYPRPGDVFAGQVVPDGSTYFVLADIGKAIQVNAAGTVNVAAGSNNVGRLVGYGTGANGIQEAYYTIIRSALTAPGGDGAI